MSQTVKVFFFLFFHFTLMMIMFRLVSVLTWTFSTLWCQSDCFIVAMPDDAHVESLIRDYDHRNIVTRN